MSLGDAAAPGGNRGGAELLTTGRVASTVQNPGRPRRRVSTPPDLWETYPDPRVNFRPTMFGLTLEEYRAEYRRRQAEGWSAHELAARFPAPGSAVAS